MSEVSGRYDHLLPPGLDDEVGRLVDAMDDMEGEHDPVPSEDVRPCPECGHPLEGHVDTGVYPYCPACGWEPMP